MTLNQVHIALRKLALIDGRDLLEHICWEAVVGDAVGKPVRRTQTKETIIIRDAAFWEHTRAFFPGVKQNQTVCVGDLNFRLYDPAIDGKSR